MFDVEASPGAFERLIKRIPDGTILRCVFVALFSVMGVLVGNDVSAMLTAHQTAARLTQSEPVRLDLPEPGDQIRPYYPRTIPVGPNRGEPKLPGYDGPVDSPAIARRMRFVDGPDGQLSAIGQIAVGTAAQFRAVLDEAGDRVRTVVLHSPGGSVSDAIEMARLIRERKLNTAVPADGYCASACPLLLAGGVERRVGDHAWVGVHQVYAPDGQEVARTVDPSRSISDIQSTLAECQQLLLDMGVLPALWIKAMQTPPDELYVLTGPELQEYAVVTPADAPGAERQAAGGGRAAVAMR
ncbi:COG3904 family protein [Mangrovibrevibacter kandeliae]|uniref:COG3904 family protein n=1 Tax=Mangrovibrevibacter kandeliae TaxID=2968473 RepID=UPI0021180876|nr:hypothetical protein [Aurantimonas sp. CSK15Z-1]MCQ8783930.1 hypothetical protein [Aurantimonas sp. CSK15Z-1]